MTPRAFRLSPDGTSVATTSVTTDRVAVVAVYDLATGSRTLERRIDVVGPIVQLSYDGSVAAVASSDDGTSGSVTVLDLRSGASRSIGAYGPIA